IEAPEISQDILDKGHVVVYERISFLALPPSPVPAPVYHKLPYTNSSGWVMAAYSVGKIEVSTNNTPALLLSYRYVILPRGTEVARVSGGVDLDDYEAVAEAYNLRD